MFCIIRIFGIPFVPDLLFVHFSLAFPENNSIVIESATNNSKQKLVAE